MKRKVPIVTLCLVSLLFLITVVYASIKTNEAEENANLATELAKKVFEYEKIAKAQQSLAVQATAEARRMQAEAEAQAKLAQQAVEDCQGK